MAATETKTKASTTAAAVSGMVLWVLGTYVFKGDVPEVLASWVYVLVPGICAWAAGYFSPHTHRPDLAERNNDGAHAVTPVTPPAVPGG
jgi:hypothetical protein